MPPVAASPHSTAWNACCGWIGSRTCICAEQTRSGIGRTAQPWRSRDASKKEMHSIERMCRGMRRCAGDSSNSGLRRAANREIRSMGTSRWKGLTKTGHSARLGPWDSLSVETLVDACDRRLTSLHRCARLWPACDYLANPTNCRESNHDITETSISKLLLYTRLRYLPVRLVTSSLWTRNRD